MALAKTRLRGDCGGKRAKLRMPTGSRSNQEFKLEARAGGDDGGDLVPG